MGIHYYTNCFNSFMDMRELHRFYIPLGPLPFILLNLVFSVQAAYAAPIIMMAQNRQNDRDRNQATEDYKTNMRPEKEIEELQLALSRIEVEKLDQVLRLLNELKVNSNS